MTSKNIKLANTVPQERFIIQAGKLKKPATLVTVDSALVDRYPDNNDPGPSLIG